MTKQIIIFLLCVFSITSVQSQELSRYKCAYSLKILSDTLNYKYFRAETYVVQIGENISKGFTYQKFYIDSLKAHNPSLYRELFNKSVKESIEAMRRTGSLEAVRSNEFTNGAFPSDLYKDYKKGEIRVTDNISIHSFVYKDELKPQDWEILPDTMTILGYHSQKATCNYRGRDWVAWFTSEIPLSEGPWKFYGLPGLITKIADDKEHYSFTLTGFQEIEEPIDTEIAAKVEKTTRKEFIKMMKGGNLQKADMESVNISVDVNDKERKPNYDYIERDYKEWRKEK